MAEARRVHRCARRTAQAYRQALAFPHEQAFRPAFHRVRASQPAETDLERWVPDLEHRCRARPQDRAQGALSGL
jgi:hypothetical protein